MLSYEHVPNTLFFRLPRCLVNHCYMQMCLGVLHATICCMALANLLIFLM